MLLTEALLREHGEFYVQFAHLEQTVLALKIICDIRS